MSKYLTISILCKILVLTRIEAPLITPHTERSAYCKTRCFDRPKQDHIMCRRLDCNATECETLSNTLQSEAKGAIIQFHNNVRSNIIRGAIKNWPKGRLMKEMYWNDELAQFAQCWANKCIWKNDACRDTMDFQVGQLLGRTLSKVFEKIQIHPINRILRTWFESKSLVEYGTPVHQSPTRSRAFAHMIWPHTVHIGCGIFQHKLMMERVGWDQLVTQYATELICNYGPDIPRPAPNRTIPFYSRGSICKGCPEQVGSCNRTMGLCATLNYAREIRMTNKSIKILSTVCLVYFQIFKYGLF